jgi:ABC-type Fe3+ transport system permease subunit
MLTVLACVALVLGTAWLLVLYPSFRKACAIVLGVAIAIPVLVYGIAEIIAFEQQHQQAVQAPTYSDPARQTNPAVAPTPPCVPGGVFNYEIPECQEYQAEHH